MKILLAAAIAALLTCPANSQNPEATGRVVVRFETELGDIEVALSGDRAPLTVANFLRYVDGGFYDGGVFHRTVRTKSPTREDNQPQSPVKIDVVQGGVNSEKREGFGAIALERTSKTGLRHVDGAISMARSAPDSATSDFFFCLGDQPELDFGGKRNPDGQGFAAFGLTLKGHEVLRKIQAAANEGQRLTPPIRIRRVSRVQ
jgi:peptidyl-prolyl cis-trans isomerase A (cyclophilin A)